MSACNYYIVLYFGIILILSVDTYIHFAICVHKYLVEFDLKNRYVQSSYFKN